MKLLNRRTLVQSLAGAGIVTLLPPFARAHSAGETAPSPRVSTRAGEVQGWARDGGFTFLGVPYGSSTAGASRFMPPRPPAPWQGIRSASAYGDSCPQVSLGLSPFVRPSTASAPPPAPTAMQSQLRTLSSARGPDLRQSEDCLALNVWTPALDSIKRPVMVWLHGGGFAVGSGSSPTYDGTRLSQRGDVVVVTINHRLNAFGHLYLGEIGDSRFASSGNVGMLDIVAALQWVRDNISAFGGDSGNVTIFGESGGAGKVSVICALPAAAGLFHKAIMQSGPCLQIADKEHATAIARQLLQDLNMSTRDLSKLQEVDSTVLASAASSAEMKIMPRVLGKASRGLIPVVDGTVLRHDPFDLMAAPESAHVPFMVGSTRDEAILFVGALPQFGEFTAAEIEPMVRPLAGKRTAEAIGLYKSLYPADSPSYLLADMVTDAWLRRAGNRVAELKVRQSAAPVYLYLLEWPINPLLRSPHGTDVPLVFDTLSASPTIAAAANSQALADQMSDAWIAFARAGNPNTPRIPYWPAYSLQRRATMIFNASSRIVDDYGKQARLFWETT